MGSPATRPGCTRASCTRASWTGPPASCARAAATRRRRRCHSVALRCESSRRHAFIHTAGFLLPLFVTLASVSAAASLLRRCLGPTDAPPAPPGPYEASPVRPLPRPLHAHYAAVTAVLLALFGLAILVNIAYVVVEDGAGDGDAARQLILELGAPNSSRSRNTR